MDNYNIVIVDDEELITSNLKILFRLEGYHSPNIFNSPLEALEYIKNNRVDLVISDFFMPKLNGIDLLKKTREFHPHATLILLTGYADKESAIRAINEVGLYRYIEKPWDNTDLMLCIRNGLEKIHLNDVIKHQQEIERLRNDFIATLTHDLRTPLLAAIQTLQFFVDGTVGNLSEKQRILLETMMYSNQDMLGLVNALLEVYKYESGQLALCKENFVLSDIINQCIKEVQPLADSKELVLTCDDIKDEKIYADKHEIKRVLANFLGNAIKNTNKGGNIIVSTSFEENEVTVSVKDTGIGIPQEDLPKLFHRFSQGTGQKRSTSTGLGLYLSCQIVEAHGGKIWAESEINKGSIFKFTVPKEKTGVLK
ncbi:MAG: hypothetical protein A2Y25_02010 [Candidatus Melainabacteria bacterium GWF2_37_15]|nr:MAG: hypothetical protein A2Y25_02010 [Candidatus Melainabacteria bacterium GWF2_37_15]